MWTVGKKPPPLSKAKVGEVHEGLVASYFCFEINYIKAIIYVKKGYTYFIAF